MWFKLGMEIRPFLLDQWPALLCGLPAGLDLEATARARGAFSRAREVRSAAALLRLALAWGACGMSLRETCAWAEASGIASLSDPSLLERLAKAGPWLGEVVGALLAERAGLAAGRWAGRRLRALDGTALCEPGANRTTWRLHMSFDLASARIDHLELTDGRGAESLSRLSTGPGEVVLADRGYARPRDLRPVIEAGADLIVRTGWNSLRLLTPEGERFDLFAALAAQEQEEGEVPVRVDEARRQATPCTLPLRLVIRPKSREEAKKAQRRLRKAAAKKGKRPDPRSLEAARFILLLTSLPAETFPAADVLALYRCRWQIELAFKRMKSLAGLDALPAKSKGLAQAWIYARLIAILLAENRAGQVPDASPCGRGKTRGKARGKPLALAAHENGARQHPRRHSRAAGLAHHPQRFLPASPLAV